MSELYMGIPVIPLRGLTILPGTTVHFDVSRKSSIAAVEDAMIKGQKIFVTAQKDPVEETPGFDGIYHIGTIVTVRQLNKLPDNIVRVMVEAKAKGEIISFSKNDKFYEGEVKEIEKLPNTMSENEKEAFIREL